MSQVQRGGSTQKSVKQAKTPIAFSFFKNIFIPFQHAVLGYGFGVLQANSDGCTYSSCSAQSDWMRLQLLGCSILHATMRCQNLSFLTTAHPGAGKSRSSLAWGNFLFSSHRSPPSTNLLHNNRLPKPCHVNPKQTEKSSPQETCLLLCSCEWLQGKL